MPQRRRFRAPVRVSPRIPEKVIQPQGVTLLKTVGAKIYVLGTKRRCGDYQGTMQTEGIADVLAFLPPPPLRPAGSTPKRLALWWEAKAQGGVLSSAQQEFQQLCGDAELSHVTGEGLEPLYLFLVNGGWLKPDNIPHYRRPPTLAEATKR